MTSRLLHRLEISLSRIAQDKFFSVMSRLFRIFGALLVRQSLSQKYALLVQQHSRKNIGDDLTVEALRNITELAITRLFIRN